MASAPGPRGSHLGKGGGSGGRGTAQAGPPALKVTMRKSPGKRERNFAATPAPLGPGSPGALRAAPVTVHSAYGEAASAPALPTAVSTLGGVGAAGPGAEEPERRPPRPLLRRWGGVAGGARARSTGAAAAATRAPGRRQRKILKNHMQRPHDGIWCPQGRSTMHLRNSSPKDMDESESSQSLMTSSQYPKEAVRKRQNSARNSGGSDFCRFSRKSFKLDYRLEEDVTKSKKGRDGRFVNPWPTWKNLSISNVLRWLIMEKNHSSVPCSKEELDKELPVLKPYFVNDPGEAGVREAGLRVTWLGHATLMVEMDELIFLTDPIFSSRASPSQYMGPKRFRRPPCTISELPRIDAVLISHNHYDHLDYSSVIALNERFGNELRWFVPLGLLDWMQKCGCENVIELDWWEENCVPGHDKVTFVFTPSQHWCKRTIMDDNKVLWGSWSVLGPWNRFFFAGDTGYCPAFEEIGKRFGPFDLAAIPIGAYEPRWFMKYQHVDPEEAVRIHIDVQTKKSVAIHWGTFALANEHYLEPPVKLSEALERYGLKTEDFFVLKHGESRYLYNEDENFEYDEHRSF